MTRFQPGYYRQPTIHGDTVVFVSEDDLWSVPASGGIARRLTTGRGAASLPCLSPDGSRLAFVGREEGNSEIYVMPALGGPSSRVTYQAEFCATIGWDGDDTILYASTARQFVGRTMAPFAVPADGGAPRELGLGFGVFLSYGPSGDGERRPMVLTRHRRDLATWKRYRGGTAGVIWIDAEGDGQFRRLLDLDTNLARGMWIGDRIVFLSDHEGIGNLYSSDLEGGDIKRLTHHREYYVRNPRSDGRRVVYQSGGELWLLDPESGAEAARIDVEYHSPRLWRGARYVSPSSYLGSGALHPKGHCLVATVRGRPFTMGLFEGGVLQHGESQGVRYRLARYTADGEALLVVSDEGGEEGIELLPLTADGEAKRFDDAAIGRVVSMRADPKGKRLAITNHKHELLLLDLESGELTVVDRSGYDRVAGVSWSADGSWLAYGFPISFQLSTIKLLDVESGEGTTITESKFRDENPCFDPEGRYLYFTSKREFNPVYDGIQFELGFPEGMRLCLVTLRADVENPFVPKLRPLSGEFKDEEKDKSEDEEGAEGEDTDGEEKKEKEEKPERLEVELEGITSRVLMFPVPEGRFSHVEATDKRVLFTSVPVEGALGHGGDASATLKAWVLKEMEEKEVASGVSGFTLSPDREAILLRSGSRLRVIAASTEASNDSGASDGPGRKSGWIDLERISVQVDPACEWEQMLREAWRLMRDQFWTEDMSGVDWGAVYARYQPLLARIGTRSEFSDLMWEMQGELGTSHAYESGGDYQPAPAHYKGSLGADFAYHEATGGYAITHIIRGDVWDPEASSPLARAGVGVSEGDVLVAIGGRPLSRERSVDQLLVNQADTWVTLTVVNADGEVRRDVTVQTLSGDSEARYRDWVEANARKVSEATDGRVGYIHIPDMGPGGYAEFHRSFMAALRCEGILVDVRFNGGGHVSQLLIEKLSRRIVGYDISRWGVPQSYPDEAVRGPIVAITNEFAGSDGDIFSHVFKLHKLGPLVGKRTWGGVIGIWPRHRLVDGSVTTQPEFSFWFEDVGWKVENYGTDPDVEVEYAPQDFLAGRDPQLEKGIELVLQALTDNPHQLPDFGGRPNLAAPLLSDEG